MQSENEKMILESEASEEKMLFEKTKRASDHTLEIISLLRNKGLHPSSACMRISDSESFEIMILIPEKEFLGKGFSDVYDRITAYEIHHSDEEYLIRFSFCPMSKSFNEKRLALDGFRFRHKEIAV